MLSSALKQVGQRVSRLDRTLIMLVVLLTSVFPSRAVPEYPSCTQGHRRAIQRQARTSIARQIPLAEGGDRSQRHFLGRTIPFFREIRAREPSGFVGLLGIDMQDEPGTHELAVDHQERRATDQAAQLSTSWS